MLQSLYYLHFSSILSYIHTFKIYIIYILTLIFLVSFVIQYSLIIISLTLLIYPSHCIQPYLNLTPTVLTPTSPPPPPFYTPYIIVQDIERTAEKAQPFLRAGCSAAFSVTHQKGHTEAVVYVAEVQ